MISIVVHNLTDVNHEVLVGLVAPAPLMDRLMMKVLISLPVTEWADGTDVTLVDGLIYRPLWIEVCGAPHTEVNYDRTHPLEA